MGFGFLEIKCQGSGSLIVSRSAELIALSGPVMPS